MRVGRLPRFGPTPAQPARRPPPHPPTHPPPRIHSTPPPPQVLNYWLTYLRYISAMYYAFEANTINEFSNEYLSCAQGLSPTEIAFLLGAFPNAGETQQNQVRVCVCACVCVCVWCVCVWYEHAFLLGAFPNRPPLPPPLQVRFFFGRQDPTCVLKTESIVEYFQFYRPFWMSTVILIAYLIAMHILTFASMLVAARSERR